MKNHVVVTGNLGSDAEFVRQEREGGAIVRFSVACSEYKFDEVKKEFVQTHINWIPIKAFGNLAARAGENLKKGQLVTVFGSLRTSNYETQGRKQFHFEVVAGDITISEKLPKTSKQALGDLGIEIGKSISVGSPNLEA